MGALRDRLDAFKRETVRITSPKVPNRATGNPVRYIGLPPQPAQPFDVDMTLQRWFQQIRQERSQMNVQLHLMASEDPDFSALYLRMKEFAYRLRGEAMTEVNKDFNKFVAADPHQPSGWYSNRHVIYKACWLYGIEVHDMTPIERVTAMEYGDGQHAVAAYLQVFETQQPPILVVDKDPTNIGLYHAQADKRSIEIWTWYAACCLSKYLYDQSFYTGLGAIYGEVIAPFDPRRHAAYFPFAHSFAKGLLHITPPLCPAKWHCGCNRIEQLIIQPPVDRVATGELSAEDLRTHYTKQDYGQASPPSRGMTPPTGTLLREYNRHKTDPNLRNPNDHTPS